jgi:hypothetical protein
VITVELADAAGLRWAQQQVTEHHYLRTPVDSRCSPLAYLVKRAGEPAGCLIFGRPEATRCYFWYGSVDDIAMGKARLSRWEVINLARVWLHPSLQEGASRIPNAASMAVAAALRLVVVDYLSAHPPCFVEEPWQLREVLSYCDRRKHTGALYRALGFQSRRLSNDGNIETYVRPLRRLQTHERRRIERLAEQSPRSRHYRSMRAAGQVVQEAAAL